MTGGLRPPLWKLGLIGLLLLIGVVTATSILVGESSDQGVHLAYAQNVKQVGVYFFDWYFFPSSPGI